MIPAELRWGNRYFLAMQEPVGYVMNYRGGNDGNRWTDNDLGLLIGMARRRAIIFKELFALQLQGTRHFKGLCATGPGSARIRHARSGF